MNLADVAEEIRAALDTIAGLRVPEWGEQRINPPAALVMLPERISYDETYGRGCDRYPDVEVLVLVPNPTTWRAVQDLAPYADGSGSKSVKQAVEAYPYTACDPGAVRVAWCEFDVVKYADVPYLAAIFHLDITGDGA
jgi:hypothetical protein